MLEQNRKLLMRFHTLSSILVAFSLFLTGWAAPVARSFPSFSALPPQGGLPDPLVMLNGERVASRNQWDKERRPELRALFEHYMYGAFPAAPEHLQARVVGQYADFLDGKATLKLVTLETGTESAPRIDLMLVVPNQRAGPAPVFVTLNFCGNHALTDDARVPLPKTWMPTFCKGCSNHVATDAGRGAQAADWPLAEIIRRGYALASFYHGDVDSDRADTST